jgi:AcrR family transcriptional regulator
MTTKRQTRREPATQSHGTLEVSRATEVERAVSIEVRDRILSSAYPLFTTRGIRDVSVEEIQRAAGVTPDEFKGEFESRDTLAAECLERREREWTLGVVEAGARARGTTPEERLLAIFDVFDEWFRRDDYEACTFINVLLEMGREHPLGRASAEYLVHIRNVVGTLAAEAELQNPDEFAMSWHILMKGSIINAVEGDQQAALRAKEMARELIARHRPVQPDAPQAPLSGSVAGRWWGEMSNPTRVIVGLNSFVIVLVGIVSAILPTLP